MRVYLLSSLKVSKRMTWSSTKQGVHRAALDLRPLTLKSPDNKIVAGCLNRLIKPVVGNAACSPQTWFVFGRQVVQNAFDLDLFASRDVLFFVSSLHEKKLSLSSVLVRFNVVDLLNCLPVSMLFDFAMASNSVSNAWVVFLLGFIGFPAGIYDAILVLYRMKKAYMNTHKGIIFMSVVLSGVLQGCPLSGSLFVIAVDPLLHMFSICLENSSLARARACADDIGLAIHEFKHLPIVETKISDFECVSGLQSKAVRCNISLNSLNASQTIVPFPENGWKFIVQVGRI